MEIRLKLMGTLKDKTPLGAVINVAENASILDVLAALEVPADSVHVFMVNGDLERDKSRELAPGDELMVIPPVGGG